MRITDEERRRRLAWRHGLTESVNSFERTASTLAGVHSTDPVSVYLAGAARRSAKSPEDVGDALYEQRSVLRMLGMRRTLFVVPLHLVAAVQRGYTDGFVAKELTRLAGWLEKTGVAADGAAHIVRMQTLVRAFLDQAVEATTRDMTSSVSELDVRFTPPVGGATGTVSVGSRIVLLMAAAGELVRTRPLGTWISSQYRYTTAERWLGTPIAPMDPSAARADLARAWLQSYGPGTVTDLQWWSGWNLTQTRAALQGAEAVEVELETGMGYVAADHEPAPDLPDSVAVLPALDSTPMGWKERDWYLGPHGPHLFDRNGNIGPTVWWNGRIVGGWAQREDGEIRVEYLEPVPKSVVAAIDDEVARMRRFIGDVRFTPRFRTPLERRLRA